MGVLRVRQGAVSLVGVMCLAALMAGCSMVPGFSKAQSAQPASASTATPAPAPSTTSSPVAVTTTTSVVTVTASSTGAGSTTSTQVATQTQVAPTTVSLPHITVRTAGGVDPAPLQRFADDIADGNIANVVAQCWTIRPARLQATYTEKGRRIFLRTLANGVPNSDQYDQFWISGNYVVRVAHEELASRYACPHINGDGFDYDPGSADVQYLLQRLDARLQGQPLHAADTRPGYLLLCRTFPSSSSSGKYNGGPEKSWLNARQQALVHQLASNGGQIGIIGDGDYTTFQASGDGTQGVSGPYVEVSVLGSARVWGVNV